MNFYYFSIVLNKHIQILQYDKVNLLLFSKLKILMERQSHQKKLRFSIYSFIYNNELIIVAEWAEKGDLKRLMKIHQSEETPFEELKIWEFMNQIASALMHMHEKRIMHRDLKPANIFIANDGSLKIGDLGLGRVFSSETIEAYSKVGTPLYMSPELLHGEGYDQKSDVWSLGCVTYELCEFKSPFRNENEKLSLLSLFENITKGDFAPINKARYSDELSKTINQMIVVNPQNRVDAEIVYKKSKNMIQQLKKSPKIDCILVNEDIYEKLGLIEYHNYFCKPLNKKPISKVFFAISEQVTENASEKFFYFAELCYWIINISKKGKVKAQQDISTQLNYDTVDECAQKLLMDLKNWGIKLPDQINISHIRSGYGDTVCFILNDLLNRELIRLNFKFEDPQVKQGNENDGYADMNPNTDDQLIENIDDEYEDELMDEVDTQLLVSQIYNKENQQLLESFDEEKKMIQATVGFAQWKKECLRVEQQLSGIQQDLNQNKKSIGDQDYNNTINLLSHNSKHIKQSVQEIQNSKKIQAMMNQWYDELQHIKQGEQRINEGNQELISTLKEKVEKKKSILSNLQLISENVNQQMKQLEQINEKYDNVQQQLENHTENETGGGGKVISIKNAIQKLKRDLKDMDIKIGIYEVQISKYQDTKHIQTQFKLNQTLKLKNKKSNKQQNQEDDDLNDEEIELDQI
ncbi:Protein kinase-like domain [Pseudocohnilembus persalinus]|uniref:non-specific serine/threonine protein kinase n=1 Tax=Pseudocohnilembus persalinus TaxID=266149 RepID=A0A0V0QUE1_PSEPJ|nr:Protein kinase-like domain [Pseudocohnilembus persalinus]|eukprot:KRX05851.1 Protein kinase-like domain [Pseudocohnilembus persalinus]